MLFPSRSVGNRVGRSFSLPGPVLPLGGDTPSSPSKAHLPKLPRGDGDNSRWKESGTSKYIALMECWMLGVLYISLIEPSQHICEVDAGVPFTDGGTYSGR